jgi:catecholate siderophore receptor
MVIKGPSSQSFGNGTTGGVIELGSKKAHLGNSESFEATGGTGPYGRGVLDVNRQLNGTTAVRIVAMGNGQDIVDRDHVYSNRFGFLGSIGFGLGTKQTVTLNYFHQHSDARPDFGIPTGSFGASSGGISEPLTEFGLPRSNYYGRSSDHDLMDADVATVRYKREIGEWLTLSNDTRFGHYTRDLAFTPSFCLNFPAATAAAYGLAPSNCASDVAAGNLDTAYTRWPVGGFKLASYGAENVTAALMQFKTAGLRHELMAGVDVYYQHQQANFYSPTGSGPAGTLLDPIFQNPPGFSLNLAASGTTAHSWDAGPFVSDRLWLLTKLSILAGVRFDHYQVDGVNAGALITPTTNFTSPKAALIWEPTKQQTYYFSYGRSFTPPGNNITTLGSSLSLAGGAALSNTKPESATNYEVGGKWTLLKDRLGATAALFRVNRGNAIYTDPTSGIQSLTDDRVRVQGVELGLTGKITPAWDVQASYSYSDSKIIYTSTASAIGNQVPYVSKNGIGLWTTYDLAPLFREFPGHLLVGGGINYRSDYYLNDTLTLRIPDATTLDAIVSYDLHRYHLAFNVKNLTNELAYSQAFGNGYATPVPGRTFLFTIGTRF